MLPKVYRNFLIRLEEQGLNLYLFDPRGGCIDVNTDGVESWLDDGDAFWKKVHEDDNP